MRAHVFQTSPFVSFVNESSCIASAVSKLFMFASFAECSLAEHSAGRCGQCPFPSLCHSWCHVSSHVDLLEGRGKVAADVCQTMFSKLIHTLRGGVGLRPWARSRQLPPTICSEQPCDVAGRCSGNARLGFASLSSKETLISRRDSLSMILTRMTVSACSVDPWALHLPPGPTWHSSYHQAKLCCVCQIHIGIYEKKNWRGRMLLTTCHIGCISPRRQARKRRTLRTSNADFQVSL